MTGLTIKSGATQVNVTGATNWAAVKSATGEAIAEVSIDPDTPEAAQAVIWSPAGEAVAGYPKRRSFSLATPQHVPVTAKGTDSPQSSKSLDLWVLWCDITITMAATDEIDSGNDAAKLAANHSWPNMLGGGNKLGKEDHDANATLTYAYTVGKIQAKGTLAPDGIEDVITNDAWKIRRKVTMTGFDNGTKTLERADADDPSNAGWKDLNPKSGTSTREIYDLDAPGCSVKLPGISIDHTAEIYANFTQWVTVTLDSEVRCSDEKTWSYEARIDVDKANGKVEANALSATPISPVPSTARYPAR